MKSRYELFSHFRVFCVEIQTQFHVYAQTPRSDNAKEYLLKHFQSFILPHGILHHISCVDTPSSNAVVERMNRHILMTVQTLLFQILNIFGPT